MRSIPGFTLGTLAGASSWLAVAAWLETQRGRACVVSLLIEPADFTVAPLDSLHQPPVTS